MVQQDYKQVLRGTAQIHIGKNGITQGIITHIKNLLKKRDIVKIKVMREIAHDVGMEYFVSTIAQKTGTYVLDVRGFTFVISKKLLNGIKVVKKYLPQEERERLQEIREKMKKRGLRHATRERIQALLVEDDTEENKNERNPINIEENNITQTSLPTKTHSWGDSYIDYENEELLEEIDQISDMIYGGPQFIVEEPVENKENGDSLYSSQKTFSSHQKRISRSQKTYSKRKGKRKKKRNNQCRACTVKKRNNSRSKRNRK